MSRLDSAIRRLEAQKACLELAAGMIDNMSGVILEIGLGNGRTYDHLLELLPERDIYVFERRLAAHPDCIPDKKFLFEGDFLETLPRFPKIIEAPVVLAHCDVGSGDLRESFTRATALSALLTPIVSSGGIIVSDQKMQFSCCKEVPLPKEIMVCRYFMFQVI